MSTGKEQVTRIVVSSLADVDCLEGDDTCIGKLLSVSD